MNAQARQEDPRRRRAIDAARLMMATGDDPEQIRHAVLECFETGVPEAAEQLLTRFGGDPAIAKSPWFIRFQSWLDAAAAEDWLEQQRAGAVPRFAADNSRNVRDLAQRLPKRLPLR